MAVPKIHIRFAYPENEHYDSVFWKGEDGEILEEVVPRGSAPLFDAEHAGVCDHRGAGGEAGYSALVTAFHALELNHRLVTED